MSRKAPNSENTYVIQINEQQRELIRRGLARLMPENEADADEWATLSVLVDCLPADEEKRPGSVHDFIAGVPETF